MSNFHMPTKTLSYIDTRPKENEIKGAVKLDLNMRVFMQSEVDRERVLSPSDIYATLDKQESLTAFIAQISAPLGLTGETENYALMFEDRKRFVTESNKHSLQQGFYLMLTASPFCYARHFLTRLCSDSDVTPSTDHLSLFVSLCADRAFVDALTAQNGVQQLAKIVEEATEERHDVFDARSVSLLLSVLQSLLILIKQFPNLVPWSVFSPQFVHRIVMFVNGQSKMEQNDSRSLALGILLALVKHCDHLNDCLRDKINVEALIRHLDNSDERISLGSLALINAIYGLADREERLAIVKILHQRPFLAAIGRLLAKTCRNHPNCVNSSDQHDFWDQIEHLQHIRFDEIRSLSLRIPSDKEINYVLSELSGNTEEIPNEHLTEESIYENKNNEQTDDVVDFHKLLRSSPPGSLAVCVLLELPRPSAAELQLKFNKIHRPHLWPLILAKLIAILVDLLGIASNTHQPRRLPFFRIVLTNERPFHALFRVLVDLFQCTWAEMHAKVEDLPEVMNVVRNQMERAMAEDADSLEKLSGDLLRRRLSYFAIQKIWKREEEEKEELQLASAHIQMLREHLRSEFEQMVLQRRINFLKHGLTFQRIIPQQQQQQGNSLSSSSIPNSPPVNSDRFSTHFWFWRLDERKKHFHFWDCRLGGGKQPELALDTVKKLPISQIQSFLHGAELGLRLSQRYGMKTHRKGQSLFRFAFCLEITLDNTSSGGETEYYLCAQDETEFALWMDGLQCLLRPQQALQETAIREEIDRLLNLEIQIRLMDVQEEGVKAEVSPTVPELPTDFSWIHPPHSSSVA